MASRIKGITVEIEGSTTGLDKALKETNSNISKTQTALKDVNRLLKVDPKNTELMAQKQKLLSQAIEETKEKLEIEKTALEQAADTDIPPDKMDALKREVIATTQELERLEREAQEASSSFGKSMQEAGQKIKDVGEKVTGVGKNLSTHVTAPIVAAGAASIAAFNEVDAGMDIIKQKTGAAGKSLETMENSAKRIATEIPTDFETAGAAIGEVNTRFGLTGKSLEDLSEEFIKFADLNDTDVSNSIDNTQKVLSAFGLTAEDAGALLDTMNAVGQRTGIGMDDLASSMVSNSAALQQMGFSAADAANFLGNVEMSGADTSQVMSGLTKALANATAEGKPMNEALADIQNSMLNAGSETEGLKIAYDLFGKKAGAAIYQACKTGSLSFEELGTSMEENLGSVDDTYEKTLDGTDKFKTGMNSLKVAGAELGETVGNTLAPMIEKASEKVGKITQIFSNLSPKTKEMIVKIGLIAAAIGPVLVVIGTLISSIGTIVGAIGTFTTFLGGLSGAGAAAGGGIALFSGPLLPIAGIIAGVVAAGVLLYKNWDTIKEKAGELKDKIHGKWKEISESTKEWWDNTTESVKGNLSKISEKTKTSIENAKNSVKTGWENVKNNTNQTWQAIQANIESRGGGIKGVINTALDGYKNIWSLGFGAINTLTGGKLEDALSTVRSKLSSVKNVFSEKIQDAKNSVDSGIEKIKSIFDRLKLKLPSIDKPKIKLPHFSISGSFSLAPPQVPSFGVKWFKDGGILSGAQIFGKSGNTLLGGGEKGNEAVLPLNTFYDRLETIMKKVLSINIPDLNNMADRACALDVNVYIGNKEFDSYIVKTAEKGIEKKQHGSRKARGL